MSVFKSQFSRAIMTHKSDNAVIASPFLFISSGTNTSVTSSKLVASTATFITNNVKIGDVVHNDTTELSATVVSVDSETQLTLNANIFLASGNAYAVYGMSAQTNIGNAGCCLYIDGAGDVSVITIGGDTATFFSVPVGTILPVQVRQLRSTSTSATNVMALW